MKYLPDGISLKTALLGLFAIVTVAAVGLEGLFSYYSGKKAVNEVALHLRAEVVERINEHVQDYLLLPKQINQTNARVIGLESGLATNQEALVDRFAEQVDLFPTVTSINFGNAVGGLANSGREPQDDSRYVIVTDGFQPGTFRKIALDSEYRLDRELAVLPGFDARIRPWYVSAVAEGGPVYSDIYILFTGQDMSLAASLPVYDLQGNFLGALSTDLFLAHLSEFLRELNIGLHGQAFIMEHSGELVASSEGQVLMFDEDASLSRRVHGVESEAPVMREAVKTMVDRFVDLGRIQGDHYLDFEAEGRKHLLQVSSLKVEPGVDWLVVVSMPKEDFMAWIAVQNRTTILLTLGVLGLALLTVTFIARAVVRPISLLERTADKLASGSQPEEIAEKSRFVEVHNLTRSFNQMSRKLTGSIQMLNAELSERRQAEDALRASEEKYRSILEKIEDGYFEVDPAGNFTFFNNSMCRILGYSSDELMGMNNRALMDTENADKVFKSFNQVFRSGKPLKAFDWELIKKDGEKCYVDTSVSLIKNVNGDATGFRGIVRDITDRKWKEEALSESERFLQILLESLPLPVFYKDVEGRYKGFNKAFETFFGRLKSELIGCSVFDINPPELATIYHAKDLELFKKISTQIYESQVKNAYGQLRDVVFHKATLTNTSGVITGLVGAIMDITERKQAEQKVVERTDLAEARARQLQALAVELIEAEERERQRIAELLHDNLQQMLASARFQLQAASPNLQNEPMLASVNEILEESIAISRRLSHELSPPVLYHGSLYSALGWLGRQMNEQFGLTIELNDEKSPNLENTPLKMFLFRAVQELLFNIVKHAGVNSARVTISGSKDNIAVTVADQGKGFSKDIIDSSPGKSGFGLINIRERADRIGGHLKIESEPGQGSSFLLVLPVQTAPAEESLKAGELKDAAVPKSISVVKRLRVLFADDHKVMRQGLIRLISGQSDIEVAGEAANGREAVELARQLLPDVIVMDISMPVMDGIEATRLIKFEFPEVRIVGLSMFEDEQSVKSIIHAGAEAFIPKTSSSNELLKAVYGNRE